MKSLVNTFSDKFEYTDEEIQCFYDMARRFAIKTTHSSKELMDLIARVYKTEIKVTLQEFSKYSLNDILIKNKYQK